MIRKNNIKFGRKKHFALKVTVIVIAVILAFLLGFIFGKPIIDLFR